MDKSQIVLFLVWTVGLLVGGPTVQSTDSEANDPAGWHEIAPTVVTFAREGDRVVLTVGIGSQSRWRIAVPILGLSTQLSEAPERAIRSIPRPEAHPVSSFPAHSSTSILP